MSKERERILSSFITAHHEVLLDIFGPSYLKTIDAKFPLGANWSRESLRQWLDDEINLASIQRSDGDLFSAKEWFKAIINALQMKNIRKKKLHVRNAPGTRLLLIADFLYSPKTFEQTFKPLIADWRYEYFEALKHGRTKKARWISFRYRYSFVMAMSLSKVFSLLKQIRSVSK